MAFRFPGGEERDEAAGLRIWDEDGMMRLQAACQTESAYASLMERCLPGTALGLVLPGPEQDQVVAGLLARLWAQPHDATRFARSPRCARPGADEFEKVPAAAAAERIDPGLAKAGIALLRKLPQTADSQVLLATDLRVTTSSPSSGNRGWSSTPSPYVGDPAYDLLQHVRNCEGRLAADPAGLANRMAAPAGIDAHRARQWLFARSVQESIGSPLMCQVAARLAPA